MPTFAFAFGVGSVASSLNVSSRYVSTKCIRKCPQRSAADAPLEINNSKRQAHRSFYGIDISSPRSFLKGRSFLQSKRQHSYGVSVDVKRRPVIVASAGNGRNGSIVATEDFSLKSLLEGDERRFLFVGGKGGVGKTSSSASLAIAFGEAGLDTLIVSTDPAHSLSDAFDQDLAGGEPVQILGTLSVYAMEVDPDRALQEWKQKFEQNKQMAGSIGSAMGAMGMGDVADGLGSVLEQPPPGIDEIVAITKVLQFLKDPRYSRFQRIIFDTAPTGHTLRLLSFPDFLKGFLGKLLKVKAKLQSMADAAKTFFSAKGEKGPSLDDAIQSIDKFQDSVVELQALFRDKQRTRFVVVTIPTILAINESERLVAALKSEGVPVHNIIVNQVVPKEGGKKYVEHWTKGQQRVLSKVSSDFPDLEIIQVPLFDSEIRGLFPLRFMAQKLTSPRIDTLLQKTDGKRYIFMGGKGGVGKTTSSAALAVKFADAGLKTLVVSTDPAHSLSDSLDVPLPLGKPVQIEADLYAMEIDPAKSIKEQTNMYEMAETDEEMDSLGMKDLKDLIETAPPGLDEAAALAEVTQFINSSQYADFDRIIFDTAPTGHTLRLLTLPDFFDGFLGRIMKLKDKVTTAVNTVRGLMGKESKSGQSTVEKIEKFRLKMQELQVLFRDQEKTQFCVVTIPTVLSINESKRLVVSLRKEGIPVNSMVVNQIIEGDAGEAFAERVSRGQQRCLTKIRSAFSDLEIIEVPFFDTEVRGIYGLQPLGQAILHGSGSEKETKASVEA